MGGKRLRGDSTDAGPGRDDNAFPEYCEATIAGLATGLVATGKIPKSEATLRNKFLRVEVNGVNRHTALVDVSVSRDRWAGSRALWSPNNWDQIFVAFDGPCALGLSSVADSCGQALVLWTTGCESIWRPWNAAGHLELPSRAGPRSADGVEHVEEMPCGTPYRPRLPTGMIALDGEREVGFGCDEDVAVRLDDRGPFTIDTEKVMARAARDGLLVTR